MRLLRWLLIGVVVGGVLLLSALARLGVSPAPPSGDKVVEGLDGPVDVLWDSLGIPQIWAGTERDALFAQGYLHATHRLWQVEMFRRIARGTLSEIFGDATLTTDRFLRTLGLHRAAAAGEALLDDRTRDLLQAYADGLNAAVAGWQGRLPPEFVLLRARPEPFTLRDVLALEKVMAWDLADYQSSLDLAAAHARLGEAAFEWVRPRYPEDGITILESAGLEGTREAGLQERAIAAAVPAPETATGSVPPAPSAARRALLAATRRPGPLPGARGAAGFDFLSAAGAVRASNAWVVGPERSRSGKPLVANDMHLTLDQPVIWYLMGLHAPGLDVVGMSLPGTAGIVAGRTGGVAWGFTNAMLDDTDLFLERVDPADPARYLTPAGSEPFRVREEVIGVRGGRPDTLAVRSTRHGPVLSDVEPRAGGELLALRWVALDPSTTPGALLAMNRAGTAESFLAALEGFTDPHQNVVFADTAGRWGYWMAGRIPDRPGGMPPQVPVPGWTGAHDWGGYLPFAEHPHALEPPSGLVATANNRQGRGGVSDRISAGAWASPDRAQRITDLLRAGEPHDAASLHAIQLDVTSLFALRHREQAARAFREAGFPEIASVVAAWDGIAGPESRAATLFHAWYEAVVEALRHDVYGESTGYLSGSAVERALLDGLPAELASAAAREALRTGDRAWGAVHRLSLDHPLASVPLLGPLVGFGRRDLPRAGTPHTVNVAEYRELEGEFIVRAGPSQRHVSDLADLDAGGFVLPGGQSGYPRGPHAFDQFPLWEGGRLVPIPISRTGAEARTTARLRLLPPGV
ncbi:MAG: penicillin acylase family protein [Longimicrobiales bacterium]|nr:penicillin acylase family protein [Longimicrobiales bacterium]